LRGEIEVGFMNKATSFDPKRETCLFMLSAS